MTAKKLKVARTRTDDREGSASIKLLSRATAVLFAFSPQRPKYTLADLSKELGINKPSLSRILRALEDERLLVSSDGTYSLGPRVLTLGNVYLSTLSTHEVALPHLSALARSCGQTVNLAMLDHLEVVYLAILHAQTEVGIQGEIGGRHPAHATSLGKVLLSAWSEDELRGELEGYPLRRLTKHTITNAEELLMHLRRVRQQGFAVDEQERSIGVRCVAAPIYDHTGKAILAASIAGPVFNMHDERLPTLTQALLETVDTISTELGYSPELSTSRAVSLG